MKQTKNTAAKPLLPASAMATGGPTAAPSDLKAPASPKPVARISGGLKSTARALDALMKVAGPTACSTRTTATSDTESDSHNPAAASAKIGRAACRERA